MSVFPFIPKEDQCLPDAYGLIVYYVNGKKDEFELASHSLNHQTGMLEFFTKDDLISWVPLSSVTRFEFDKRFSKIIDIKNKNEKLRG